MRILVIGGMHGNEPLGLEVVQLFKASPVAGVDVVLANEQAIQKHSRFIKRDLNRSFPGTSTAKDYELRRAAQILNMAKGYDVVLDFHNTHCPNNDCSFVGETASKKISDVAWLLGLERLIITDYDCINKYVSNCLSVEVSLESTLNKSELWYERIRMLSVLEDFVTQPDLEFYRFVYRITLEDKQRLALEKQNLRAFRQLPDELAKAMNVESPAFPIFIGDDFTPYNYGGLLNKIN